MIKNDRNLNDLPGSAAVSLMDYIYLLWGWAWLIILAGALAGGVTYFISHRTVPTYQTSASLFVSVPTSFQNVDSSGLFYSNNMTTTYSNMLTGAPVLQGVIDKLGLAIDPDQLRKAISVSEITNTQLIMITVSGTDPSLIVNIANTLGAEFAAYISNLQSDRYAASKDALSMQMTQMAAQVDNTTTELAQLTDPTQRPALEARLAQYKQLYASLVNSFEQVRMAEAQTTANVTVSDPARNASQTGPKTMQNILLAVVLAMVLVAVMILAIDAFDDSINNPEEIRQKFNLPILGVVASYRAPEGKTIAQHEPRSPVTESFRSLRTNITYASVDRPLGRVVVTSPSPQDGKTTVITNLGVVMAQGGKTVAVVDADLHRPTVHKRFGLPNLLGLSELFVSPLDEIKSFEQTNEVHGLTIITSGALPPNPTELLTSHKMIQILDRLNQDNDLVLIDTPPVLSVTDAAALSAELDGVILVAKPGVTKLAALKQTLEQLRAVGARVMGVVLNDVEPKSRKYGYYYHRYYSKNAYYYSPDGTKKKKSRTDEAHPQ